jgi:hypothetical protein
MPECQFPVFCCFCVSKKLHRKYSQNWTKQKPNIQNFTKASRGPKRRRRGATSRPHNREGQPKPWPHPLCVRLSRSTSNAAPSPIKTPRWEKPKDPINFQETHRDPPSSSTQDRRVQKLFLAPCRRGESPSEVFFITMLASGAMSE